MCVYCQSGPYIRPAIYKPNINFESCDKELAGDMHKGCVAIKNNETYYVGSDNRLHGYRWANFPMRIFTKVKNKIQSNEDEVKVVRKITQLFNFILNINTSFPILVGIRDKDDEKSLGNTDFALTDKFYWTYTALAEKVLQKYSKEDYVELYNLAHRIIHERPVYVEVPQVVLRNSEDSEGGSELEMRPVRNVAKFVKDSSYEFTTVWNE